MKTLSLKEFADGWFCEDCPRWYTCYSCNVTKKKVKKILDNNQNSFYNKKEFSCKK